MSKMTFGDLIVGASTLNVTFLLQDYLKLFSKRKEIFGIILEINLNFL